MTDNITLPREVGEHLTWVLEECPMHGDWSELDCVALNALRTALAAEPTKQEPVAWQCREHGDDEWFDCSKEAYGINPSRYVYRRLYTAPPATHPGYVIGSHWLETAYSRICAGEAEADVLRDIGLVREEAFLTGVAHLKAENEALRRDAERYRWLRDNAAGFSGRTLDAITDAAIDAAMENKT